MNYIRGCVTAFIYGDRDFHIKALEQETGIPLQIPSNFQRHSSLLPNIGILKRGNVVDLYCSGHIKDGIPKISRISLRLLESLVILLKEKPLKRIGSSPIDVLMMDFVDTVDQIKKLLRTKKTKNLSITGSKMAPNLVVCLYRLAK